MPIVLEQSNPELNLVPGPAIAIDNERGRRVEQAELDIPMASRVAGRHAVALRTGSLTRNPTRDETMATEVVRTKQQSKQQCTQAL